MSVPFESTPPDPQPDATPPPGQLPSEQLPPDQLPTAPPAAPVPAPVPASPAPGWYADPTGQQRWWDGTQWGIAASSAVPATSGSMADQQGMATLAQVLAIFTGFLGPLVIWFMARPDQPFVKHHAAEALNFQITVTIAAFVSALLILVIIGIVLLPVVLIGAFVLEIMAAVAANRGEWYRFPVNLRLVPGAQG